MTAYGFEREEWRCAVEAAEDAGELDTYYWDRPGPGDFYDEDDNRIHKEGGDDESAA